jgi:putative nucleotidyltransferase with HDIG domain
MPQLGHFENDNLLSINFETALSGYPMVITSSYGKGTFCILAVPDDFADLYRLPQSVLNQIRTLLGRELFVTLGVPSSAPHVRDMDDAGVLPVVLPEAALMRGVTQNEYHHLDVWRHSLEALEHLEELLGDLPSLVGEHADRLDAFLTEQIVAERPRLALLKFATLLHDAGKPPMREVREGKVIFYGHTRHGAEMVRATCERLRLSARETAEATTWVDRHLVPADLVKTSPLTEKRCARFFRRNGESGLALDGLLVYRRQPLGWLWILSGLALALVAVLLLRYWRSRSERRTGRHRGSA